MNFKKIFSIELLLLFVIPLIYVISWRSFFLSISLALVVVSIAFILFHKLHDIVIFLLGMILGSIGEIYVVYSGVWEYQAPHFLGIPLWLSLFWGYVFLLIRRLGMRVIGKNKFKKNPFERQEKYYFFLLFCYLVLIFLPSLCFHLNLIMTAGLFILTILLLYKADHEDVFFAIIFILLGIPLEILSVHSGIWIYGNPDIFGIPLWVIFLYSGFALFIKKTAYIIVEKLEKKVD